MPSGVWDASEYEKLPTYDGDTGSQSPAAFRCHLQNGRLCAGWVGCHDMQESLGLRIALLADVIDEATFEAAIDYVSPVPLWGSGAEACAHGKAAVETPDDRARQAIAKLVRRRNISPRSG